MVIKTIDKKEIHYKAEPHTVTFTDDGEWWALEDNDEILSVLCIREKKGSKYLSSNFTPKEHRHKGYFSLLLDNIVNVIYPNETFTAHCLEASRNCYTARGFQQYKVVYYKYGTQYHMIRRK